MIKRVSCTGVEVWAVKRTIPFESGFTFNSRPCFPFMRKSFNCREHCSFGNQKDFSLAVKVSKVEKFFSECTAHWPVSSMKREKKEDWTWISSTQTKNSETKKLVSRTSQSTCHQGFSRDRIVKTTPLRMQNCRTVWIKKILRVSLDAHLYVCLDPTGNDVNEKVLGVVVLSPLRSSARIIKTKKKSL